MSGACSLEAPVGPRGAAPHRSYPVASHENANAEAHTRLRSSKAYEGVQGRKAPVMAGPGKDHGWKHWAAQGRGRGRGRGPQGGRGYGRGSAIHEKMTRRATAKYVSVKAPAAAGPAGGPVSETAAYKQQLAKKCTTKFHGSIKDQEVTDWYNKSRHMWPCPEGGFRSSAVWVFWDIENCRPEPEYAPLPINYATMMRDAFKIHTHAATLRVVASLSKTYPGSSSNLNFTRLIGDLNVLPYMDVFTAPGKTDQTVHKDVREADSQLKAKMQYFLEDCKPGDVAIIISGDNGYSSFAHEATGKGVNVIVMGPSQTGTAATLMANANMFMDWPAFAQAHGKDQIKVPTKISPLVKDKTQSLLRDHVERFSFVKSLDMVCLIDITNSMGKYMEAVCSNLSTVLDKIALRFPWAKDHLRVGLVGYRDFMYSCGSRQFESCQFEVCPLGDPAKAYDSARRVKEKLGSMKASGGADSTEDVIGGLLEVASMLEDDRQGRSCILFHICDAPQHGHEFHNLREHKSWATCSAEFDAYPDGPLNPLPHSKAQPPPGRTKPWRDEAAEVLNRLKSKLNVSKYVLMPLKQRHVTKMVQTFKQLVDDPEPVTEWSVKKAAAGQVQEETDPWITLVDTDMNFGATPTEQQIKVFGDNLVRNMVGTALATVTHLSQLGYNVKKGLRKREPKFTDTRSAALSVVAECGEEDLAVEVVNAAAAKMADGSDSEDDTAVPQTPVESGAGTTAAVQAPAPQSAASAASASAASATPPALFNVSISYKEDKLKKMEKDITRKIKQAWGSKVVAVPAEEVMLCEPPDIEELIANIQDGERLQRAGKKEAEIPPLLTPTTVETGVCYVKSMVSNMQGAQRMCYEAVREEEIGHCKRKSSLVVMKEFLQSYQYGNSRYRYRQLCQGNVVASYLARVFNNECVRNGITEVHGQPMPELAYLPCWTATYKFQKPGVGLQAVNHHVEPYILGSYLKYNSNAGFVNTQTMNDACQAFSHWTYEATDRYLMVTDVQGVKDHKLKKILLTDPAVHCVPMVDCYFDPQTNRGPIGVLEFFMSHTCNDTCRRLGLTDGDEELKKLKADALGGKLPCRCGEQLDLDAAYNRSEAAPPPPGQQGGGQGKKGKKEKNKHKP